ncbi:putative fad binding domain protein [Eutypa lata UCREL1]|uniref:Putative fad binding domain protein n=1 Tax=Eutypa lata (strain UCR-EL1) TaxID=1287681 RepID=M7T189_EUTLA|nr:putative fad binding domain protein [Eutypa lata UCREL1]
MASAGVKARRAAASVPFLLIAAWCFRTMDIDKLVLNQQPFVDSGVIEWDGGKVTILDHFHHVDILDTIWRGTMATFSPSTFGYDSIASWQMFSFLTDLGPVYAVWILESYRPANAWTPAYFPTFFSLAGQLLGLGSVAPFFYFLCFAFGPTASELSRSPVQNRTVRQGVSGLLLPIVFLFHTAEVFAMFLAPEYTTRHFWTWAWQLSPFWIGITHLVLSKTIARPQAASKVTSSTLATPLKTLLLNGASSR